MLDFNPPLLNSANPWATSGEDLLKLYLCPDTGAVTTRTCTLQGFKHDNEIHQYSFFDAKCHHLEPEGAIRGPGTSSLNTLGYSPYNLAEYLSSIRSIIKSTAQRQHKKPFIVSVTGSPSEIAKCHAEILDFAKELKHACYMEVNLSCPNIAGKPPPAYNGDALKEYFEVLPHMNDMSTITADQVWQGDVVPIGIKTPPYTYSGQFETLISALLDYCNSERSCPVSFITATNTLGSSLSLSQSSTSISVNGDISINSQSWHPTLSSAAGTGIGGLAGAALHPLALGNVSTLRRMLDEAGAPHEKGEIFSDSAVGAQSQPLYKNSPLRHIQIIGVGGVSDRAGFERMLSVGARCVGVGTALGAVGHAVFEQILHGQKQQ